VGGVEGGLYVFGGGLGELGEQGAVDGAVVGEVLSFERGYPFAADEVVVAGANATFTDGGDGLLEDCVLNFDCCGGH
jgi:hypothetical protein